MSTPNSYVIELLDYLIYVFQYYNKQNLLFKIIDKYLVHILIDNTNYKITIEILDNDTNYNFTPDVILVLTEDLLIELYNDGISVTELLKKIKNGSIKTEKFKLYRFLTFIKNFDLSPNKWTEFSKQYKEKVQNINKKKFSN